jgi:Protein of unknown function (DUF2934)
MPAKKEPPAERRVTERRTTPKTAPKTAGSNKPSGFTAEGRADVSPEELRKLVSEAAYYRAKQRGFEPGHELEDWIQAEADVIRRLNGPSRAA